MSGLVGGPSMVGGLGPGPPGPIPKSGPGLHDNARSTALAADRRLSPTMQKLSQTDTSSMPMSVYVQAHSPRSSSTTRLIYHIQHVR